MITRQRVDPMFNILFVCHGNICRSAMAESMAAYMIAEDKRLSGKVAAASAATHPDELGNPPYFAAAEKLRREGIPLVPHRARLLEPKDLKKFDLIVGMDGENLRHMRRILGPSEKICLLLDFTARPRAIADPWYTGDFDATFSDLREGLSALFSCLLREGRL